MTSANAATVEPYAALAVHRDTLDRASRSAQVATIIRNNILAGHFRPGARLSEPDICEALKVSRNTVREAFRTLIEERLVTHELNRGVFVRVPAITDIAEVYKCRRIVECAALRDYPRTTPDLTEVAAALECADRYAAENDWAGVGTADVDFHRAITALNNSSLLDSLMAGVWNELRLIFHVVEDANAFHLPYLHRNHEILTTLTRGDSTTAATMLADYLADAESQIRTAYTRITTPQ
ncbi:GntR family transcriptional regulator [Nocardia sp. CDC153]|uniref:GntR family transcriptional regulator n=1 Tax=Nocardia sp. CDC153 TaxID=3112167 RepID=UPI002DB9F2F6|nr:GntR family transcriptional regulator [Nocardia sp. CDC153]MEC3958786.1 GntR family transcriptional regulator [Nocardia sp. CDC153]